ncbi:FMR1-interacting protein NUFIP2 [Rhineura floridana]|uniref:FMR1-interacting protein NUFIP2 n=1 Tax=Rhineura floridana TaxID=261503 RepID=UPI002AC81256|nr:FMR1-interacting protein NUFIP2 [Rhineura floridana]
MEEQPGPQQQQQQHPPPHHHHHHHHHHHYYYYNHNHHQHHQQYLAEGSGPGKAQPQQKAPLQALKHEPKAGGGAAGGLQPPQHEAPRKKAGYGELNGNVGERESSVKSLHAGDASGSLSRVPNGSQSPGDPNLSLKQTVKVGGAFGKPGLKPKSFVPKGGLDKKPEKCYENKAREGQSSDKSEPLSIPNGIVASTSSYITNGYVSKGTDDGSGSESGYTTPKKRKGRRNSIKGCETLNLVQESIMQHELPPLPPASAPAPVLKQEPESFKPDCGEPKAGSRVEGLKPAWKCEAGGLGAGRGKPGVGEVPRKNSDGKVGVASKKFEERPKGKHVCAATSKEDSWTLFKPPPVFPVDNSSAKIVPKISYASKVKENLNKAAQNPSTSLSSSSSSSSSSSLCSSSAAEAQAQPCSRLSQVPMSAMKSVTSANFSNGPVLAGVDRGMCPAGPQSLLTPAACSVLSAASELAPPDTSLSSVAMDQPKSSLFIYPSNMQADLINVATQAEPPFQTNQQSLGDIFQNQWGLSFINEPSAGPETAARKVADSKAAEVTFQGECPAVLISQGAETATPGPDQPVFPKAYELDKRTSLQLLSGVLKLGTAGEGGGFLLESHRPGSLRQAELAGPGAFVFLSKDCHVENRLASPTNSLLASAKEQRCQRGLERKDSWGDFDLSAAVLYHIQEMETICNLQKQDPKRIITYDEAMDHPNQ